MSRIEINAGSRHIIVDHGGELEPLRAVALILWQAVDAPQPSAGPAVGFVVDRRWTAPVAPLGNGSYSQPPAPVTAGAGHGGDGQREGP